MANMKVWLRLAIKRTSLEYYISYPGLGFPFRDWGYRTLNCKLATLTLGHLRYNWKCSEWQNFLCRSKQGQTAVRPNTYHALNCCCCCFSFSPPKKLKYMKRRFNTARQWATDTVQRSLRALSYTSGDAAEQWVGATRSRKRTTWMWQVHIKLVEEGRYIIRSGRKKKTHIVAQKLVLDFPLCAFKIYFQCWPYFYLAAQNRLHYIKSRS